MRRIISTLSVGALALLGTVATTGTAQAAPLDDCKATNVPIGLHLCLFYNSNYGGSWVQTAYNVSNFSGWVFPNGQPVKNNTASAYNTTASCGRLYYNSNYAGPSDLIPARSGLSRLVNTYNDNASFAWC
ncbi:peptidase inhibitor family I36 protein [Streptomyces sp. NPDC017179]|uniref:peptidase inhibitor family I36 protein n=1 Tax=Streptomyces sp. NPDC017179 TaxID=3364979 RepID=UPI0037A4F2F4